MNYDLIEKRLENERKETDITPSQVAVGENDRTADKETVAGGNQSIIIIILGLALGLVVLAGVVSFLIKTMKDRRIKAFSETEEYNENYGNLTLEEYYEEERQSEVVHSNDYYNWWINM